MDVNQLVGPALEYLTSSSFLQVLLTFVFVLLVLYLVHLLLRIYVDFLGSFRRCTHCRKEEQCTKDF